MAKQTGEQIAEDSATEALARSGEAANEIMKAMPTRNRERQRLGAAVQEFTKAIKNRQQRTPGTYLPRCRR